MQSLVCSSVDLEEQHNILHLALKPSCYCAGLTKRTFLENRFSILLENAKKNATLDSGREHENVTLRLVVLPLAYLQNILICVLAHGFPTRKSVWEQTERQCVV